jgi:acetyl esterase/lipase
MDGLDVVDVDDPDFYLTDAITDHAVDMIDRSAADESPFFLYLSYTAPHWPLHALEEDIAKYERTYRVGWDTIRAVVNSDEDDLRASGEAFGEQLKAARIPARVELEPRSHHGHLDDWTTDVAKRSIDRIVEWLTRTDH